MLRVQAWAQTDVGRQRKHNEDNYIVQEDLGLYGVADGMGGHAAGEVASELALQSLEQSIEKNIEELRSLINENPEKNRKKVVSLVNEAIQFSTSSVYNFSQKKTASRGMGTTLSAILIIGNKGIVAHVGDSRIYLVRNDKIMQLTEDHSLVHEQLRLGLITEEEAERSPYKNVITRAVGATETIEPDILVVDLQKDDLLIICSDGLHGYINEQELESDSVEEEHSKLPGLFIDKANERGGRDNITSIVICMEEIEEVKEEKKEKALVVEETVPTEKNASDLAMRQTEISLRMDVLQKIPLFEHMSYEELVHIMSVTFLKNYENSEIIFKEGSKGDLLYIVLQGELGIFKSGERLGSITKGEHFGELAVIEKLARTTTIIVESEEVDVLTIQRKNLLSLLRDHQGVAVKLLWGLMKGLTPQLRNMTERFVDLLKKSSKKSS